MHASRIFVETIQYFICGTVYTLMTLVDKHTSFVQFKSPGEDFRLTAMKDRFWVITYCSDNNMLRSTRSCYWRKSITRVSETIHTWFGHPESWPWYFCAWPWGYDVLFGSGNSLSSRRVYVRVSIFPKLHIRGVKCNLFGNLHVLVTFGVSPVTPWLSRILVPAPPD
jgi:hypothetical protein